MMKLVAYWAMRKYIVVDRVGGRKGWRYFILFLFSLSLAISWFSVNVFPAMFEKSISISEYWDFFFFGVEFLEFLRAYASKFD